MEAFSFFKSMLLKIILKMFFVMLSNTPSLSPSSVSEESMVWYTCLHILFSSTSDLLNPDPREQPPGLRLASFPRFRCLLKFENRCSKERLKEP